MNSVDFTLSPAHKDPNNYWKPNTSYSLRLKDVKEQLTPAEVYRHKLLTTAKDERILRRLEWKWEVCVPLFFVVLCSYTFL